jgi:hypothetical protein
MILYSVTIVLHVVVAVLGVGLIAAVPIAARLARRDRIAPGASYALFEALLRSTQVSLAIMFLTGALLDYAAGGAFHGTGWFKASVALFFFLGFSHARARATLRKGPASDLMSDAAGAETLARVERWGWVMCGTVAAIAALMEAKPLL